MARDGRGRGWKTGLRIGSMNGIGSGGGGRSWIGEVLKFGLFDIVKWRRSCSSRGCGTPSSLTCRTITRHEFPDDFPCQAKEKEPEKKSNHRSASWRPEPAGL